MFRRKLRFFLHRWHRRLGLTAAIVVILVSLTGIFLNHTGQLDLAKHYPQSALWLWPYPTEANTGITLDEDVIYQTPQAVYLNRELLPNCQPPLQGATQHEQQIWILCNGQLLYFEQQQLIESIESMLLGGAINQISSTQDNVIVRNGDQWYALDSLSLQLGKAITAPSKTNTPIVLSKEHQINHTISWQKVILDLHSGRFFGPMGIYIVDAAAIILLLLSLSGFWIWFSRLK